LLSYQGFLKRGIIRAQKGFEAVSVFQPGISLIFQVPVKCHKFINIGRISEKYGEYNYLTDLKK